MGVSCDRCNTKGGLLTDYENLHGLVLCQWCADEVRNEK
jgi:hypothetical protein